MTTNTTSYLCIGCPLGCRLEVDEDDSGEIVEIRGFACKRGKTYATQEHTAPQRIVTTTVSVTGGRHARLPVRTNQPVPKESVKEVCQSLRTIDLAAPIHIGDVVVSNVLNTGADIIASRSMAVAVAEM